MKNKFIGKTFLWMFLGLMITFLTGLSVTSNKTMLANIYNGPMLIILIIIELFLVIFLSARVMKLKPSTAKVLFILYSFINGLTLSSIFIYYELSSIIYVFFISSLIFFLFGLLGYFTKFDLTNIKTYLYMLLLGIIICLIINLFFNNSTFNLLISIIGLILFMGITAYDMQKLKNIVNTNLPQDNYQIYCALSLYLDYINIFLHLLSLFGNSRE